MIDFAGFDAMTFDCYGTLIDWERGILGALDDLLGDAASSAGPDRLLEDFGRFEPEAEAGPHRSYREVLHDVALAFGAEHGVVIDADRAAAFAASVADWPPFPDSPAALARLAARFRLAIVSNVDDDLFAGSAAQLGVDFAEVVTAQQVRSYKPARAHFDEVLTRLDLPRDRVLHVAQSLYHDIAPAKDPIRSRPFSRCGRRRGCRGRASRPCGRFRSVARVSPRLNGFSPLPRAPKRIPSAAKRSALTQPAPARSSR